MRILFKKGKLCTAVFILFLMFMAFGLAKGQKAEAYIPGVKSSVFPDTSLPGGADTYAVVQLRQSGAQVRAQSTIANIYVPVGLVNQNIAINIQDGCNNSGPDIQGWVANTLFYIEDPNIGFGVTTASNCGPGGTIPMNFIASPSSRTYQDNESGVNYYVYKFRAQAYGSESQQYLNAFRLIGGTGGVFLGVADTDSFCDNISYPKSCPSAPPGQSLVYSTFYNRGNPFGADYGQTLEINTGCKNRIGGISLYDLDASDPALNQVNLHVKLESRPTAGGPTTLLAELDRNELIWIQANDDQYANFPGNLQMSLAANTTFIMTITGVSYNNAIQARPYLLNASDPNVCGSNPQGYIDSCQLEGGHTVIYGWAYDGDSNSSGEPPVNLTVNGTSYANSGNINSDNPYRDAEIEAYLGVGPSKRSYGFRWDAGVLNVGGLWAISGTVLNVGGGSNQGLGLNTAGGAPAGGFGYGFPGGAVPVACQQPPNVTISGSVYDAQDSSIKYAGVFIYTCVAGVSATTDGAGNYSFTIPAGTYFCVGSNDLPTYTDAIHPRPTTGWGYLSCPNYPAASVIPSGQNPNYCTASYRYDNQQAGQYTANGYDRGIETGYDFAYTRPQVNVQGAIYNAYNLGQRYDISIQTCASHFYIPASVSTSNGVYNITMYRGDTYCLRPSGALPSGYYNVRPWSEGYGGCAAHNDLSGYNYCAGVGTYEWQVAGGQYPLGPNIDRNADNGFDFVFRFAPVVNCNLIGPSVSEAGTPFTVQFNGIDNSNSLQPKVTSGNYSYTIQGIASYGTSYAGGLDPRGSPGKVLVTNTYTAPAAGAYPFTGSITAVGDGIPAGPVACGGLSSVKISTFPYFKTYGEDVVTGNGFDTTSAAPTCPATPGNIYAYAQKDTPAGVFSSNYKGAGAQNGAMTRGSILGFFTAANRTAVNTPPKSLTFANTAPVSTDEFGGNYGAGTPCITDYFSDPALSPVNGGTRDPGLTSVNGKEKPWTGVLAGGSGKYRYLATANTNITGISVPVGQQLAIYVDGDLTISGDITFASGASLPTDLPNLAVIVRGNIFITPNVKRIDGLYVAQPKVGQEASKGRVYTCALPFAQVAAVNLATTCGTGSQPLAINGSLVAQQVKLLRAVNSLKDSTYSNVLPAGEIPNFADGSSTAGGANTKAAEVINYTPEMYLAPSALKDPGLACINTNCNYDSIFSLPPVY
ncbi:MAG: exported protein of unknown function [Candidatus Saccharibacteria bacterium]|nr:exported protein of unknown function [Candidatus Saccharibacteria bacterium]